MNIDFSTVKKNFLNDGFVVLPALLSSTKVAEINKRLEGTIKHADRIDRSHLIYEKVNGRDLPRQIQDLQSYDPFFAAILETDFKKLAEILLEDQVMGKTVEYFNKFPGRSKATPPHQDGFYFMLQPSRALTVWIALEDIDEENGCLRYGKKSHLEGMRAHEPTNATGFSQGIIDYGTTDLQREVVIPARAGDVLIHHSLTVHRADANESRDRTRKALGLIYFGRSAKEDTIAKSKYLEQLAKSQLGSVNEEK